MYLLTIRTLQRNLITKKRLEIQDGIYSCSIFLYETGAKSSETNKDLWLPVNATPLL